MTSILYVIHEKFISENGKKRDRITDWLTDWKSSALEYSSYKHSQSDNEIEDQNENFYTWRKMMSKLRNFVVGFSLSHSLCVLFSFSVLLIPST